MVSIFGILYHKQPSHIFLLNLIRNISSFLGLVSHNIQSVDAFVVKNIWSLLNRNYLNTQIGILFTKYV